MTRNQIDYWALQENKRHNLASENLGADTLHETTRHNVATENVQLGTLNENVRHNKATESVQLGTLHETTRHNVATENVQLGTLNENIRHNVSTENLTATQIGNDYRLRTIANQINSEKNRIQEELNHSTQSLNAAKENQTRLEALKIFDEMDKLAADIAKINSETDLNKAKAKAQEIENQIAQATKRGVIDSSNYNNNIIIKTLQNIKKDITDIFKFNVKINM